MCQDTGREHRFDPSFENYNTTGRWVVAITVAIVVILVIIFASCSPATTARQNSWTCARPCTNNAQCWIRDTQPTWSVCENGVCTPYAYAESEKRPEVNLDQYTFEFKGETYHIDGGPMIKVVDCDLETIDAVYHPPPGRKLPELIWM